MKLTARDEAYLAARQRGEHAALARAVAVAYAEIESRCDKYGLTLSKREYTAALTRLTAP